MHILVLDRLADDGLQKLQSEQGLRVTVSLGLAGEALRAALADADIAICRSGVTIDPLALEGNDRLKAIIRAGVGTDNIDKQAATRRGIIVMNTPAANTISTAEHTMALMLGMSRNLAAANQSLCDGKWDRKSFVGTQLHGKTLGIIGLGRIGREVTVRAQAFGMRVVGFDAFLSTERARELNVELADSVEDLLPQVDFLTVHTPLTAETQHLLNQKTVALMKDGARVVNCARGGIYEEATLEAALESGKLAGAALDVYEEEPCTDSKLFNRSNTLCTPHLGASTEEAQAQVSIEAVDQAINFFRTGEIRHAVNAAALDPQTIATLSGQLNMIYRLGMLLSQWNSGCPSECRVRFQGDIASKDTRLLSAAFCAGLLEHAMDEPVNIINAELLMADRGIHASVETSHEPGAFSSSVHATLTTGASTFSAAGTLFGNNMPRLIMLDQFRLEAFLDGIMLLFRHNDVPGIIGKVGTIFGDAGVNIAQMAVGRAGDAGGPAVGILNLDSLPDTSALETVEKVDGIEAVKVIQLPPADQLPRWLPG